MDYAVWNTLPGAFGARWENGAGEVGFKRGQTDRRGGGEKARNLNGARKQPADRLTEGLKNSQYRITAVRMGKTRKRSDGIVELTSRMM